MRHFSTPWPAALSLAAALLLTGCANTSQPLYYWGDYEPQLYGHFTKGKSPEEQISALEAGIEKARAKGQMLPPGYNAHLGILYAQGEHADQMLKYFEAEKTLYPEATAYVDFLTRKFKQPQ
ncbi:DUF4810 domain-containing protein [Propionivibrio soli]|uniref:DUF4810 domain-containing protein n=1 Tax=Propionivibrio soli TaxID=2976531 RepID=UPI0021E6DA8E|nr:DUF4810 domain-containing protein [Propionivibrio soli]